MIDAAETRPAVMLEAAATGFEVVAAATAVAVVCCAASIPDALVTDAVAVSATDVD